MSEERSINKSFLYIIPLVYKELVIELNLTYNAIKEYNLLKGLENVYSFYNDENKIVIEFCDKEIYELCLGYLIKSTTFVKTFTEPSLIIVLDVPKNVLSSYNQFITGKYSKFEDVDKHFIYVFIKEFIDMHVEDVNGKKTLNMSGAIKEVLFRSENRIEYLSKVFGLKPGEFKEDWELSSIIDKNLETYYLKEDEIKIQENVTECSSTY